MTRDPTDPFKALESIFNQMTGMDSDAGPGFGGLHQDIAVDVADFDDEIEVLADLPGVEEEDIDIQVKNRTLTLSVEQSNIMESQDEEDPQFVRRERSRSMQRAIQLPANVSPDEATAKYSNGVLTVTIPKLKEADGHSIDIE